MLLVRLGLPHLNVYCNVVIFGNDTVKTVYNTKLPGNKNFAQAYGWLLKTALHVRSLSLANPLYNQLPYAGWSHYKNAGGCFMAVNKKHILVPVEGLQQLAGLIGGLQQSDGCLNQPLVCSELKFKGAPQIYIPLWTGGPCLFGSILSNCFCFYMKNIN